MSTPVIEGVQIELINLNEIVEYDDSDANDATRTHIVNPPNNPHIWQPGMGAQDIVDIARSTEQNVKALCGYVWVPKRNPEKYDVCENCMSIARDIDRSM